MSTWTSVGSWLKENAGSGAALVGSLLTGNIPGAIAAGASLVSSATGTSDPIKALATLQSDPATLVRLKELALQEEQNIREHLRAMTQLELEDKQAEHHETQETIRNGDRSESAVTRFHRPGYGWVGLLAGVAYVFLTPQPDTAILITLLTLPFTYMGVREVGKGIAVWKK